MWVIKSIKSVKNIQRIECYKNTKTYEFKILLFYISFKKKIVKTNSLRIRTQRASAIRNRTIIPKPKIGQICQAASGSHI